MDRFLFTRMPEEVLEALVAHYSEPALLKKHPRVMKEGADAECVYVYRPAMDPEAIEIIAGSGGYADLIAHPDCGNGSNFMADAQILRWVLDLERTFGKRSLIVLRIEGMLPVVKAGDTQSKAEAVASNDNEEASRKAA